MVNADRQTIMETNRSLRNIKTELENLLEKGVIDESVFDTISSALPEESPLSGPLRTTANRSATPASNRATPAQTSQPTAPPTQAMQDLSIQGRNGPPPSYEDTPPPGPPPRASKPIIAHARALYRYAGADARDVALEKDDRVAVHEYMNNDWWMGQNLRTGQEGIFPRNYVLVEQDQEKTPAPFAQPQPQYGYPAHQQGPPMQQNPYNSSAPPMAVAEGGGHPPAQDQQQGDSKAGQYGKKFGKKLGNAAIFGAGATIGSNIVNSIF